MSTVLGISSTALAVHFAADILIVLAGIFFTRVFGTLILMRRRLFLACLSLAPLSLALLYQEMFDISNVLLFCSLGATVVLFLCETLLVPLAPKCPEIDFPYVKRKSLTMADDDTLKILSVLFSLLAAVVASLAGANLLMIALTTVAAPILAILCMTAISRFLYVAFHGIARFCQMTGLMWLSTKVASLCNRAVHRVTEAADTVTRKD